MKTTDALPSDYARQSLNLVGAPLMWILSSLGFFSESARTAGEFSDMSDNLLVPLGIAFSIWFPIFVGCIAYGIVQAMPNHRTREIFRRIGWWTAVGFFLICGWALITAYAPANAVQWGTALIFIPAVAALIRATIILSRNRNLLDGLERWTVAAPIALIAGWCSLAVFLNWTPIAYDAFAGGEASVTTSLLMLAAALGFVIWMLRLSWSNPVYVFPALWGLTFLALRHLLGTPEVAVIGWATVIGIFLLLASTLLRPKLPIAGYSGVTAG